MAKGRLIIKLGIIGLDKLQLKCDKVWRFMLACNAVYNKTRMN